MYKTNIVTNIVVICFYPFINPYLTSHHIKKTNKKEPNWWNHEIIGSWHKHFVECFSALGAKCLGCIFWSLARKALREHTSKKTFEFSKKHDFKEGSTLRNTLWDWIWSDNTHPKALQSYFSLECDSRANVGRVALTYNTTFASKYRSICT